MGPIWTQQDPGGPHVGPMNISIWVDSPHKVPITQKAFQCDVAMYPSHKKSQHMHYAYIEVAKHDFLQSQEVSLTH